MHPLLSKDGGHSALLLGNEAIVRGALEAGVAYASTYPGTPASEIGDTFYKIASDAGIYFEYSTNEKVALEFAMGAAFAGARSICSMKHVGVNVAADALTTLMYTGVVGGLVLVSADDPGCHSSQNEQDNRIYAALTQIPVLEPSTPQEAYEMVKEAFEMSEALQLPFMLRTTTRVSHMRAPVVMGPLKAPRRKRRKGEIPLQRQRFVCIPAHARPNHSRMLARVAEAGAMSESSPFNAEYGNPDASQGIITNSVTYLYGDDILTELALYHDIHLLKIGFSHPFPRRKVSRFLQGKRKVLIMEELEPVLEQQVRLLAQLQGSTVQVLGKEQGFFPREGELTPDLALQGIARFVGKEVVTPAFPGDDIPSAPLRPPTLCAGCPHRSTYFSVLAATGGEAVFETDIGCYTLGVLPPLETAHHTIDMGSSINTAAALSRESDKPVFAFIGDSTFFHSGITGLINAVHNQHTFTVVIMDNRTTAMTGHQPHPGSHTFTAQPSEQEIDIEKLVLGCGVKHLKVVNPHHLKETIQAFEWAMAQEGVSVVITRAPCALLKGITLEHRAETYQVNQEKCRTCGSHSDGVPCGVSQNRSEMLARSKQAIMRHGEAVRQMARLAERYDHAPCVAACPAGLCVQGYMTLAKDGRFDEALRLIREHIPFPSICGFVCDRPCEDYCIRRGVDEALAIRDLKRYIADSDPNPGPSHYLVQYLRKVTPKNRKVAIVGAGPAGLTAAHDLLLRGYQVTIVDREAKPGGIMRHLIPEYRLPRHVVDKEIDLILQMGAEFRGNTEVDYRLLQKLKERYDAVVLAMGAGPSSAVMIETEDPSRVVDAFTFLKGEIDAQINSRRQAETVIVVGGGNAAVDCARRALRLGVQSHLVYRRTRKEMPAGDDEVELALKEGVEMHFLRNPIRSFKSQNNEHFVELQEMRLGEVDSSGRSKPVPILGRTQILRADWLIYAIGQQGESLTNDVMTSFNERGSVVAVDHRTLETPIENVYAAGDVIQGPASIIKAIAQGKRVAWSIDCRFSAESETVPPLQIPDWEKRHLSIPDSSGVQRRARVEARGEKRGDWPDYTLEQAKEEAARCLSCGSCGHCLNCIENFACPALYFKDGKVGIDENLCVACGVCAQLCPNRAIEPILKAPPVGGPPTKRQIEEVAP